MISIIKKFLKTNLLISIVFLMACTPKSGDSVHEASDPTLSSEKIEETMAKAKPLIEETTGRGFKSDIRFKIVRRAVVRDVIQHQTTKRLKKLMKGLDDDTINRQAETNAHLASQNVLGLYSARNKEFYIVLENVKSAIDLHDIKSEAFDNFIFLVITHEMVHALDDQHYDLTTLADSRQNIEEAQALTSVIEGHASYVTREIARKLNIPDYTQKVSTMVSAGITDEQNAMQQQIYKNIYVSGTEFVEAVVTEKGISGIANVFQSPPTSTRQIVKPKEYLTPTSQPVINCVKLLENIKDAIPTEGMMVQTMPMGAMNFEAMLNSQSIPEPDKSRFKAAYINGAILTSTKQALRPVMTAIVIFSFNDPTVIGEFNEMGLKLKKSDEIKTNADLNSSYTVMKDQKLDLPGFKIARFQRVKRVRNGTKSNELEGIGIVGGFYISIASINHEAIDEEKIIELLGLIQLELIEVL